MFDVKWIRENAETFDAGLARRGTEPLAARVIELDDQRRSHIQKLQDAQSSRNTASKEIGRAMASGDRELAEKLKSQVGALKQLIQDGADEDRKSVV